MPDYYVYDRYGNRVGRLRSSDPVDEFATIVSVVLVIVILFTGIFVIYEPLWAAYKIGQRTWRYYGFFTRLVSGLLLTAWILIALGLFAFIAYHAYFRPYVFTPPIHPQEVVLRAALLSLGILGIPWIAYLLGKSRRSVGIA